MKEEPYIGITSDVWAPRGQEHRYELVVDHRYPEAVKAAGGFPVILPIAHRPHILRRALHGIDGLIIVGGDDVDPALYGERVKRGTGKVFAPRLKFECNLYHGAKKLGIPVLGICYGMQLINVLEGGTLHQDIKRDMKLRENHRNRRSPYQAVRIEKSRLRRILGRDRIRVHCEHHQAVRIPAPGFSPVAFSRAGVIEAIESSSWRTLAVQWHPERTLESPASQRLFHRFIRRAVRYRSE